MSDTRAVRIGIDVGGTFTHAVAIDHRNLEIIKTICVPTTHRAAEGVAAGIAQCLDALIGDGKIAASSVAFVAHSTTQATNALLEGDVAQVGLLGLVQGVSGARAKHELEFGDVPLAGAHAVKVHTAFLSPDASEQEIKQAAESLKKKGAGALVIAQPFAVDDPAVELRVIGILSGLGLPLTATHQVSGLYGLRARARTSVINAAILPRMMEVSSGTRKCVEQLGVTAPLMIMRSDGGVMDAARMGATPILTILSGPAAGVSAAILHPKHSNGLFVEVGGTSTDISLILNGKPQRKNAVIGGHVLYLKTLDVRTVGIAGGSMVRVKNGKIADVGPRSAHIAGLEYSCFNATGVPDGARIEYIAPLPGDPGDYAVVDMPDGSKLAITTTCAANALGRLPEGDYARSKGDAARKAVALLAAQIGKTPEQAAEEIIRITAEKICKLCRELIADYECKDAPLAMVGGGGGASVVAPPAAKMMSLPYSLAANAPVVSAVGAAMAMMKEFIEKSIVSPTEEDIRLIRSEAINSLVGSGCDPASLEVEIEVDARRGVVRATATGSSALVADKKQEIITGGRAAELAAASLRGAQNPSLIFEDDGTYVFQGEVRTGGILGLGKKTLRPAVAVDSHGLVKLSLKNSKMYKVNRPQAAQTVAAAVQENTVFGDGGPIPAPLFLIYGGKVIELSRAGSAEAVRELASIEIKEAAAHEEFCLLVEVK